MRQPAILAVDDNPLTLKMITVALRSAEFRVLEAPDAQTALSLLETQTPDLILLDLLLPDMDGFELLQRLRSMPPSAHVPIIALSGLFSKADVSRALSLGCNGYLIKPVEPSQLIQTIQAYLPAVGSLSGEPGQGLTVLVADDHAVLRKLLQIRLSQLGFQVISADDGLAALSEAHRHRPDAIVSDILMPQLDGFGLCQAIRQDPDLGHTPVVLTSAAYIEEDDRRLSQEVGATAFVLRTPGFQAVIDALLASLNLSPSTPPPPSDHVETEVTAEHTQRVIWQLERQVAMNATLSQEVAIRQAQLSILAGVAEVLVRAADIGAILDGLLSRCREASDYALGAFYLLNPDRSLSLRAQSGCPAAAAAEMETFCGHLEFLCHSLEQGDPVRIPSARSREAAADDLLQRLQVRSVLIIPLISGRRPLGVLVMGSADAGPQQEALDFFRAVAGQISQALDLSLTLVELTVAEQQFRDIAETAAEVIIQTDVNEIITYMNPAAEALFDYPAGGGCGQRLALLLPASPGGQGQWESEGVTKDGRRIPLEGSTRASSNTLGHRGFTHVLRDLTERRQHEAQLTYLANYDALTGLFNRHRFLEEVERHVARARCHDVRGTLLLLGLDQFKSINDALGRRAGDMLLRSVAVLLKETLPEGEILARLEGDKFGVLLPLTDTSQAEGHAIRVLSAIADRLGWLDGELDHVTASTGIVPVVGCDQSAEIILGYAETALYHAKEAGRNRHLVFDARQAPGHQAQESLNWRHRISDALLRDRFRLFFQPVCHTRDQKIFSYEVLLRLVEDDGRVILPGEFLGIAERYGLIAEIDRWVVHRAIHTIAEYERRGHRLRLEVNLSARSLTDPHLLPLIQSTLAETGVPAASLCFEITESAAITNLVEAQRFIATLKAQGCYFALDDFGIGFSSFYYLKNLPVDVIKIDGSFIRDLARSETDQHLVRAIVAVAQGLRRATVAEFVGDAETLQLLREFGVDFVQGFYLGKPQECPAGLFSLPEAPGITRTP